MVAATATTTPMAPMVLAITPLDLMLQLNPVITTNEMNAVSTNGNTTVDMGNTIGTSNLLVPTSSIVVTPPARRPLLNTYAAANNKVIDGTAIKGHNTVIKPRNFPERYSPG